MAKVFVVNDSGHDFSKAKRFGELVPITQGKINIYQPQRDLIEVEKCLGEFSNKEDYLLLSGNTLGNMLVALTLFVMLKVKSIMLLVYDTKTQDYLQHTVAFDKDKKELRFIK